MTHAGRSVIVSGSTVAVGLLSMLVLPLPFIRSIGIGGMLIPAVSVLAAITLLPAMLAVLGPRINSAARDAEAHRRGLGRRVGGFWNRWSRLVTRRPLLFAATGLAIVGVLLFYGAQLNPSEAQAEGSSRRRRRDRRARRARRRRASRPASTSRSRSSSRGTATPAALDADRRAASARRRASSARPRRRSGARAARRSSRRSRQHDGAAKDVRPVISNLQHDVLPALSNETGLRVTLGGAAAEERDFVHAVYGNFPYVLLFVIVLTYILLARAFRSVLLPLKAVILNLVSLGAAYGIIVFIFQKGHGAEAIWNVPATDSIIPWIPLMIFAFLYGLSMDYEVFMLTRMREALRRAATRRRRDRARPRAHGQARDERRARAVLAFFVLSTSPGTDIKQFGIGLAAGVIFDATVIRALLVPSLMRLIGDWNWWMPQSVGKLLFVRGERAPETLPASDPAISKRASRGRVFAMSISGCTAKNEPTVTTSAERDADLQRHLARRRAARRHGAAARPASGSTSRGRRRGSSRGETERRGDADDHQPDPAALVRRREGVELADEAAREREAGEAEHEDPHRGAEERPLPAHARRGCRASPVAAARARARRRPRTRRPTSRSTGSGSRGTPARRARCSPRSGSA